MKRKNDTISYEEFKEAKRILDKNKQWSFCITFRNNKFPWLRFERVYLFNKSMAENIDYLVKSQIRKKHDPTKTK